MDIKKLDKEKVAITISEVISNHYHCHVLGVKYLGGGSFGMAYKVDLDCPPFSLVAKAYRVDGMCEKESYDIQLLGKHSLIKYPEIFFSAKTTDFELLCMEYIEGKALFTRFGLLLASPKKKAEFASKIVESMSYTHSYTNEKFGDVMNPIYDNWLDYYKPFAMQIYGDAKMLLEQGKLEHYIVDAMTMAMDRFDDIFCEEVRVASLIHGDLNVMNIMVKKSFEISAIIDPLNACFADKEYDLFQLNNLTGKCFGLYKQYKANNLVSKNCDVKCAFYGLWNEVYCYIKAGTLFKSIMNPLVKNMKKQLKLLK